MSRVPVCRSFAIGTYGHVASRRLAGIVINAVFASPLDSPRICDPSIIIDAAPLVRRLQGPSVADAASRLSTASEIAPPGVRLADAISPESAISSSLSFAAFPGETSQ